MDGTGSHCGTAAARPLVSEPRAQATSAGSCIHLIRLPSQKSLELWSRCSLSSPGGAHSRAVSDVRLLPRGLESVINLFSLQMPGFAAPPHPPSAAACRATGGAARYVRQQLPQHDQVHSRTRPDFGQEDLARDRLHRQRAARLIVRRMGQHVCPGIGASRQPLDLLHGARNAVEGDFLTRLVFLQMDEHVVLHQEGARCVPG